MDRCDHDGCDNEATRHYTRPVSTWWEDPRGSFHEYFGQEVLAFCDEHKPQELLTR